MAISMVDVLDVPGGSHCHHQDSKQMQALPWAPGGFFKSLHFLPVDVQRNEEPVRSFLGAQQIEFERAHDLLGKFGTRR